MAVPSALRAGQPKPADARERLLDVAYELFEADGINSVGIARIISEAAVAKTTLYHHFESKEDLVVAALERHEVLWTVGWLEREVNERGLTPDDKVLAIFDAFDDWFRHDDFHGCFFANTLLETHDHPGRVHAVATEKLFVIRAFLAVLAAGVQAPDPDEFSRRLHMIMLGSIIAAMTGDTEAARRAKPLAQALLTEAHSSRAEGTK